MSVPERRRAVAVAGHVGDQETAARGLHDADPSVRATALGALERLGALSDDLLARAFLDPAIIVRRRAGEVAATHPSVDLLPLLADDDPSVVEVAAWSCGEHERNERGVVARLVELGADSPEPLVREAAVAALGAIGDERALPTILAATADRPAVRRRAVLALAPFDGPDVDAAIERALGDRDWQVRQAAEDLRRAQNS